MCVEKDNSAVKGNFFIDQGYPRASQVFSPGGTGSKQLGFHSYGREKALTVPLNTIVGYQLGDPIAAYHYHSSNDGQTISNTLVTNAFGGYLVLPSPDDGGNCIELNTVSFGKSEAHACSKHTSNLAVDCEEGRFSAERYISNVFVEKTKGSAAGSSSSQGNTDALHSIRIAKFTDSSGVIISTDLEDVPNKTMWDESSRTCTNALKSMTYNVRYNHTAIHDISVEVETIDLLMDGSSNRGELQQEFAVNFIPIELQSSERSLDNNNVITRNRSGNPGYIVGAPVLGAMSPTDANHTASYVIAQRAGLTVMDTGLVGQCSSSSTTGSVSSYMLYVAASLTTFVDIHIIQWPNKQPQFVVDNMCADCRIWKELVRGVHTTNDTTRAQRLLHLFLLIPVVESTTTTSHACKSQSNWYHWC